MISKARAHSTPKSAVLNLSIILSYLAELFQRSFPVCSHIPVDDRKLQIVRLPIFAQSSRASHRILHFRVCNQADIILPENTAVYLSAPLKAAAIITPVCVRLRVATAIKTTFSVDLDKI